MTLEMLFQFMEALAVTVGVILGLVQLRQFRLLRERTSALELLHSFQTPEFAKALLLTYALPDDLPRDEVVRRLGDDFHLVYAMTTTWESLGVLVHRGEIGLDLVADFFSGPIILGWAKLQNYFREERKSLRRETVGEWFEWLRDRLVDFESKVPPQPANIEYREWKPPTQHRR
jgi:hypothetical protein